METGKVWNITAAMCVLVAFIAIAYTQTQRIIRAQAYELAITAYIDCLIRWDMAKARIPSDSKPPSGSEVCARYK